MAAVVFDRGDDLSISAPSGWTLIERTDNSDDVGMASYYKVAGGSEPSSYSWSVSGPGEDRAAGGIIRYTGVDASSPIVTSSENEGDSSEAVAPSVVTTAANQMVAVFFGLDNDDPMSEPSGTSERFNVDNADNSGPRALGADFVKASAGATGSQTADIINDGTDDKWVAHSIVLREVEPDPATLTVTKIVENDNGGEAVVGDFDLFVGDEVVVSGVSEEFEAGKYVVSEEGPDGYSPTFSGDCAPDGTIEMEAGEDYECIITNEDQPAELTIVKNAIGGNDTFSFDITGEDSVEITTTGNAEEDKVVVLLDAGTYTVTEAGLPMTGWDPQGDTECEVTVGVGEEATCEFTNIKRASLTLTKFTSPADGQFQFDLTGGPDGQEGIPDTVIFSPEGEETWNNLLPGEYNLTETILLEPEEEWSGSQEISCTAGGDDLEGSVGGDGFNFTLNPGDSLNCTVNNTQDAAVSGQKFEDPDGAGEGTTGTGLEGWTITFALQIQDNPETEEVEGGYESPVAADPTDENGNYDILLQPGTYRVCEEGQSYWYQSYPNGEVENAVYCESGWGYELTLEAGSNTSGVDFGNYQTGSISGFKWHDLDADGVLDPEEEGEGLSDWTIQLNPGYLQETTSGGVFQFNDIHPGNYTLTELMQPGWAQTFPGGNGELAATLTSGGTVINKNFGNVEDSTISGVKWEDTNANGVFEDEDGLSGWWIYVDLNDNGEFDGGEPYDETEEGGYYEIGGLLPGTYVVREIQQTGYGQTFPVEGFHSVILGINDAAIDVDFGNAEAVTLTGAKYHDENANGSRGYGYSSEPGIEGWTIFAEPITEDGEPDTESGRSAKETMTDGDGNYAFDFLSDGFGWWRISEEQQEGWTQTEPVLPSFYDVFISDEGEGDEEGPGLNEETGDYEYYDFGNWQSPIIEVFKWNDENSNGVRDALDEEFTEVPVELWPMALGRITGEQEGGIIDVEIVDLALTGVDGFARLFAPPVEGNYVVLEGARENWDMTYPGSRPETLNITFAPGVEPIPLEVVSFFDIFIDLEDGGNVIDEGNILVPSEEEEGEFETDEVDLEFGNHETIVVSEDEDNGEFIIVGGSVGGGGQVLGATDTNGSTDTGKGAVLGSVCELPLTAYLRRGRTNDPQNVMDLQSFLNTELALQPPIPLTGFFGPITEAAVKAFQLKYYEEVLKPWVDLGFLPANTATGIVFKTTLWKIQMIGCPDLNVEQPIIP